MQRKYIYALHGRQSATSESKDYVVTSNYSHGYVGTPRKDDQEKNENENENKNKNKNKKDILQNYRTTVPDPNK